MPFMKSIPIGTLYSVQDTLCQGISTKVSGCYRSLRETLLTLAKFYLNKCSGYDLFWFAPNTFSVAIGGDGAPFGKDDVSCSWLISFLNIGRGVLSSNENFLLFGANCAESSLPVIRYAKLLHSEIEAIEQETFTISLNNNTNIDVKFRISELPNDMKMLAFLSGELPNSAKYFSSFSNVSGDTQSNMDGTFGRDTTNNWRPWDYDHRLSVVKKS